MQQLPRFHAALMYIGFTLLFPLILPISGLFQLIMSQMVSVVWAELNPVAYSVLEILFVYGTSAAATALFMVKMRVDKRLQAHYASPRLWLVGCVLFFIVFIVNILAAAKTVNLVASDKQLLAYILMAAKIIFLVACARVLIGVLPRANKQASINKDSAAN